MKKILFYALIVACSIIAVLIYSEHKLREENKVYAANQTALLSDVEKYKTESGLNAASVQKLTLDYKTLRDNYEVIAQTAEDLGVQLKRAQSVSESGTKTEVQVKTVVRDSVVFRDGVLDTITAFVWRDPWIDVVGDIKGDSVSLGIQSRDTIVQIVHKVPHKFWFIKWGCKAVRQEMVSRNPHTEIEYTNYIELK